MIPQSLDVQHIIRLVQDQHLDPLDVQHPFPDHVHDRPWGSDDDLRGDFRVPVPPVLDGQEGLKGEEFAHGLNDDLDLTSEFSRRS